MVFREKCVLTRGSVLGFGVLNRGSTAYMCRKTRCFLKNKKTSVSRRCPSILTHPSSLRRALRRLLAARGRVFGQRQRAARLLRPPGWIRGLTIRAAPVGGRRGTRVRLQGSPPNGKKLGMVMMLVLMISGKVVVVVVVVVLVSDNIHPCLRQRDPSLKCVMIHVCL